ncbi:MAG TPA: hypothetical protein VH500_23435 [Nitrososphaeraceae archaeon]|jgi:hypothetical protein
MSKRDENIGLLTLLESVQIVVEKIAYSYGVGVASFMDQNSGLPLMR